MRTEQGLANSLSGQPIASTIAYKKFFSLKAGCFRHLSQIFGHFFWRMLFYI